MEVQVLFRSTKLQIELPKIWV